MFNQIKDTRVLAQAIVDTVREPLLVLDGQLRVVAASRSFYATFQVSQSEVVGCTLYELGDGQWNIPSLRTLLENILAGSGEMEAFEVEHEFPNIGQRSMLLNARQVYYQDSRHSTLLLALQDITDRRTAEREKATLLLRTEDLLRQKEMLLQEMEHRIANSLQIIASILMLKARNVTSEETRLHLKDAHQRVLSIAAVQQHLHASWEGTQIQIGPYLSKLCESLAGSMIGDSRPISLRVVVDGGTVASAQAASLGLIVTELVINSLKYAFPKDDQPGEVTVSYDFNGADWKLMVADNGVGKPVAGHVSGRDGLGTSLIKALAHKLDAKIDISSSPAGMSVAITHATFTPRLAQSA